MQLGCCIPIEMYELAAAIGYDYAELPAWQVQALGPEQMEALLVKKNAVGLPVPRLNAYCPGNPAIVGPRVDDAATRSYARTLMRNAAALGVETIGIGAPSARNLPEQYDRALADSECIRFLQITAEEAAPYGITLLVESVHSGMCNYINTLEEAARIMRRVSLPQVRLMADLYHMETQGEDRARIQDYLADIRHVHVSTAGEGLARGLYGTGDEDSCQQAFHIICAAGYHGTISIEPDVTELNEETMKTALAMMRRACEKAQ